MRSDGRRSSNMLPLERRCIVTRAFAAAVIASRCEIDVSALRPAIICTIKHDIVRLRHVRGEIRRGSRLGSTLFQRRPTTRSAAADRLPTPGPARLTATRRLSAARRAMINCDVVLYDRRSAYFTARLPRPRRPRDGSAAG